MNLAKYVPNAEWNITENTVDLNMVYYQCCEEPYADLTFRLTLKRKITFQIKLMVLPTLLLSAVSLFMFWIPAHRPDRTALGEYHFLFFVFFSNIPSNTTSIAITSGSDLLCFEGSCCVQSQIIFTSW